MGAFCSIVTCSIRASVEEGPDFCHRDRYSMRGLCAVLQHRSLRHFDLAVIGIVDMDCEIVGKLVCAQSHLNSSPSADLPENDHQAWWHRRHHSGTSQGSNILKGWPDVCLEVGSTSKMRLGPLPIYWLVLWLITALRARNSR